MDHNEFISYAAHIAARIVKYNQHLRLRPVVKKNLKPGFMKEHLTESANLQPQNFFDTLREMDHFIIPNMCHWNHPQFYAYFPAGNSYPSVLAEMIITGIGAMNFNFYSSPALTFLEFMTCDMYAKLLELPDFYHYTLSDGVGGGCLQNSCSDGTFICMLAARNKKIAQLVEEHPDKSPQYFASKLVAYVSVEAHSSVEKAAKLNLCTIRLLPVETEDLSLSALVLQNAIEHDTANNLIPFFFCGCIGTTGTAAVDDLSGIEDLLPQHPDIWYHVDAAYAAPALMLPEMNWLHKSLELSHSFVTNPYKWLLTGLDGSVMWVKKREDIKNVFKTDKKYFSEISSTDIDLCEHGLSFYRRFRILRLYFTLRSYGRSGLMKYLRKQIRLSNRMKKYIEDDPRFELVAKSYFALVCFRLKDIPSHDMNALNTELLGRLNSSGHILLTPHEFQGKSLIRHSVNFEFAEDISIDRGWEMINTITTELLKTPVYHNFSQLLTHTIFVKPGDEYFKEPVYQHHQFGTIILPTSIEFYNRNIVDEEYEPPDFKDI